MVDFVGTHGDTFTQEPAIWNTGRIGFLRSLPGFSSPRCSPSYRLLSKFLEFLEEIFDQMPPLVHLGVMVSRRFAAGSCRDDGFDATLIKRLPNRSQLVLVNSADASKIGVMNQWVQAKDVSGATGWVAAWYVEK